MKIISRYILREHVGPFLFALTALTSLMLLNFISRQLGELVGKGLPTSVIGEFFMLSVPFTVALTLPMSVLVAVLYAFSRLAAENEVTALKASGVSPWRLVAPAIVWGFLMSVFLLAFNDQVLPRANHRLKQLQDDISQTKPTFLLKEQVINAVSEGKLYLKAGQIDQTTLKLRQVVIYDLADATRRRTIYADSGTMAMAPNRKDLNLELFHGEMQEVATDKPSRLDRLFYDHDVIAVKDVAGGQISRSKDDPNNRGDRELGVCEMQKRLRVQNARYDLARREYQLALKAPRGPNYIATPPNTLPLPDSTKFRESHGIAWAYCTLLTRTFGVKAAQAAELSGAGLHASLALPRPAQDTIPKPKSQDTTAARDTTKRAARDTTRRSARDTTRRAARDSSAKTTRDTAVAPRVLINGVLVDPRTGQPVSAGAPLPGAMPAGTMPPGTMPPGVTPQPGVVLGTSTPPAPGSPGAVPSPEYMKHMRDSLLAEEKKSQKQLAAGDPLFTSRLAEAKLNLERARHDVNRFEIEIHKKFALAAACLIFVVLGAPIALRFPRGGVGLVIGVSLVVFALYYVGLIGGEAMANKGLVPPFWSMWGTNVILMLIGVVLLLRMGREESSGRGGDWGDRIDRLRDALRPRARAKLVKAGESA